MIFFRGARLGLASVFIALLSVACSGSGAGPVAPVPTATPVPSSSATPQGGPSATPAATPSASPTATATASLTPQPSASPTVAPTPLPTPTPTPSLAPTASPSPSASPSPTATPTPVPTAVSSAYVCPSSDSLTSVARAPAFSGIAARAVARHGLERPSAVAFLAVAYDRTIVGRSTSAIAQREQQARATLVRTFDFPSAGTLTRVVRVSTADLVSAQAALRAQFGVRSVDVVGGRRYRLSVTAPYYPNDPYYNGFPASNGQAATFHVAPYDESANVPGQWDMHAISLEHAFAYSQAGNGSGIVNPLALGSASVKIAIIDTGEDPNHPELQGKLAAQRCFITDPNGLQSTSNFSLDPDGHGTDVSGIAAAATNNAFGFTGAGGNVMIYGYRIFPTPDANCESTNPTDAQCSASTTDIVSAIQDAIANNVNVISLSLGGGGCTNGADQDSLEGQAIGAAIAKNIVVVAAAGNDSRAPLEAPACVNGVIAAGATSLADGKTNGSGVTSGTANAPVEYVASYSDHGTPGAALHSASAWGIVAPGGDPGGNTDADELHWIINIWTSTPFSASDAGACTDDYPNLQGTTPPLDCVVIIAGTSMSTPHIAGAAALILSVNSSYQSPAKMKQLLCATADDIKDPNEGCGRLNVYRAMATALKDPKLP